MARRIKRDGMFYQNRFTFVSVMVILGMYFIASSYYDPASMVRKGAAVVTGEGVPNIRSERGEGIHKWSSEQIVTYLGSGEDPDGDYAGSLMFDVIDKGTEMLSESDLKAITAYLKDLPLLR